MDKIALSIVLQLLPAIIGNPEFQGVVADPIAKALVDALPDVLEDDIADFLTLVATKVRDANA